MEKETGWASLSPKNIPVCFFVLNISFSAEPDLALREAVWEVRQ